MRYALRGHICSLRPEHAKVLRNNLNYSIYVYESNGYTFLSSSELQIGQKVPIFNGGTTCFSGGNYEFYSTWGLFWRNLLPCLNMELFRQENNYEKPI